MRIWESRSVRSLGLTLLCLFFVIYPLWAGPGPVNTRGGGDSPFLFIRLEQLVAGLRSGAFPVRWMPDAAYGLGYPFFSFYASLPYYLAALLRLIGWGPILSLQATQALGFILAAAAMTLLARRAFHHPAAVALAVAAYTCAPFHLVNIYVRGDSLSEFYAFVFYPLIFWALIRVRDHTSPINVACLALSYGGLFLTHNLSALIFSPFVALYGIGLLVTRKKEKKNEDRRPFWQRIRSRTVLSMVGGGLWGLTLSATLWLTAWSDLGTVWMGHKEIQTSGFFNYAAQFRGRDLVQPRLWFDYAVSGPTPYAMGLVQTILIVVGALTLIVGWLRRKGTPTPHPHPLAVLWMGGLLLSTAMITPLSRSLWDHLPLLPVVQFPWRFLSIQAFFGALIIGGLAQRLPRPWWVATAGTALMLFSAVGNLHPEYLAVGEADISAERMALFESFTTNIGTTIRGEYLPKQVEPRPYASAVTLQRELEPAPVPLTGRIEQAQLVERNARRQQWQVTIASEGAHLTFYTLYFPGWQTTIDGEPVDIEPLSGSGLISIHVPRGTHTIDLRLVRTTMRWVADLLSLSAGLAILAVLWPAAKEIRSIPWRRVLTAIFAALILSGALVTVGRALSTTPRTPANNDLSMDFDRMPFLHHNPKGIDFAGLARLENYNYKESVDGGDSLTIELRWGQQNPDLLARVSLVTPANPHPDLVPSPPSLAQAHAYVEGPSTVHALSIPQDAAAGLYYLTLQLFDGSQEIKAVNARGDELGTTYLRPVWVLSRRPARADDPVLARFGEHILLRDDVQVETDGTHWDVKLTWQATAPLPANYSCSLRLLDVYGDPIPQAQRDFEGGPGYGFWPTSGWRVGEWVTDRLRLPVPPHIGAEDVIALNIVLYDRSKPAFPPIGSAMVPLSEREHLYQAPEMDYRVETVFGDQIKLLGYDLDYDAAFLRLTLHWQAAQLIAKDLALFVHLFDPQTETIATQFDGRPLKGMYPTSEWQLGEVVSDRIALSLTDVSEGSWYLALGLYDLHGDRLPVVSGSGKPVPGERLILDEPILVRTQE